MAPKAKRKPNEYQHQLETGEFILPEKITDADFRKALLLGVSELIKRGEIRLKDIEA